MKISPSLSRTSNNRPRSNLSSSCSVHRLNLSSSCSNHVFPMRLPLKKLKPEPWQRLFDGEKRELYSQQGLTLKKNKQNIDAIINEEFFHLKDERSSSAASNDGHLPADLQKHLDQLYEQIDELALQLAEERLNHQLTKRQAESNLSAELEKQNQSFQEFLHRQMIKHQHEMEEIDEKHSKELNEEKRQSMLKEEQLNQQIEFLKTSFHLFKINTEKENEENLQKKIDGAMQSMKKESEEKEEEMKKKLNEAILKERKNLIAKQKMEMENLRKQHEKEIDTIHKNFASSAFDRTRVESLTKELTTARLELEESKERAVNLALKLKDLEIQHSLTLRDLNEFRTRFDEKTKEVERAYASRLDQLHLDNADLRNMYLKKCAELVDERMINQSKTETKAVLTRKQLQRKLLNVRIASATPLSNEDQPRRLSVCATANAAAAEQRSPRCFDPIVQNTRRRIKLRRRASLPLTEEEKDIVRYFTSITPDSRPQSASPSRYNFEKEKTMIENLSFDDLQQTFKSH